MMVGGCRDSRLSRNGIAVKGIWEDRNFLEFLKNKGGWVIRGIAVFGFWRGFQDLLFRV